MADRRKLKNILLQPRLQFRYAFKFFVFSALSIGAIQVVSYFLVSRVVERVLTEAGPQTAVLAPVIDMAVRTELLRSAWMLPVVCVAALAFTSKMLHRFIGPAVPIKRHVDRLADGDYGAELKTRSKDEMQDVVDSLNKLSGALRTRHSVTNSEVRASREAGFSLVELLVVLAVIMIIGMIGVSQFITAYDRSRQRSTLGDLRTLASANGTYSVDHGDYADTLPDLAPYHLGTLPPVDRWGFAWEYSQSDSRYTLSSRGSDGAAGPAPPAAWDGEPFECDLVVQNGTFTQAPGQS
ncbi:MAG: HAMP domain-containing protein [Acidobacteria bacterium]|nr:HAMP domain-containing protein [Acidobacteriota bacterium]